LQSDKDSANLYFELLDKSNEDYRLNHALSYVLTEKISKSNTQFFELTLTITDYNNQKTVSSFYLRKSQN